MSEAIYNFIGQNGGIILIIFYTLFFVLVGISEFTKKEK